MLRFQWTNSFKREPTEPNIPSITELNAEWVLFQVGRDVQLYDNYASSIKNESLKNWVLPGTLKNDLSRLPSWSEADLFGIVMTTFLKFISKEKGVSYEKEWQIYKLVDFVKLLVYTKIKVEDDEVMIFTKQPELIILIKKALKNEKYTIRTISSETEANLWWVPIMNGK